MSCILLMKLDFPEEAVMTSIRTDMYKNPWSPADYKFRYRWFAAWKFLPWLVPLRGGRGYSWRKWLLTRFGAKIGHWANVMLGVKIRDPRNLEIGNFTSVARGVNFYNAAKVTIGENTVVSANVFFCTATHDHRKVDFPLVCKPITVGSGVWLAMNAFILPGVTIGDGAVVGACSVVTKDVDPWTIVAGNPARVVGKREMQEVEK